MSDIKSSAEIVNPQRVTFHTVDTYDAAAVVDAVRERFASLGSLAPVVEIVPDEPSAENIVVNINAWGSLDDAKSLGAEIVKAIEGSRRANAGA